MSRRVLGIFLSLFVLVAVNPQLQAGESSTRKSAQKQAASKQAQASSNVKKRAAARKKGTVKAAKTNRKKPATRTARVSSTGAVHRTAHASKVGAVLSAGELAGLHDIDDPLSLKSSVALVMDQRSAEVLFAKNADVALPIASLTKLMTALIVVEAGQNLDEVLTITADDIDRLKNTSSRLRVGARMTRREMLHLALMSSENRAASALGRNYPGGLPAFVAAMNARARSLGMRDTHYVDPTGLSSQNKASAHDLAKLALAVYRQPLIREYSTHSSHQVEVGGHRLQYRNSNRLVDNPEWEIGLQKTGYISEAGRCLIMQARIEGQPVVMVFLDSRGKDSRLGDAARVRKWLESSPGQDVVRISAQRS